MKVKPGTAGWLATAAVVLAAELLDEKTMSTGFREYSADPIGRYVVVSGWVLLSAHLFGLIPPKYDPLTRSGFYIAGRLHVRR